MADCRASHPSHMRAEYEKVTTNEATGRVTTTTFKIVPDLTCTRLAGHDGDHAGYMFSIIRPTTWSGSFAELMAEFMVGVDREDDGPPTEDEYRAAAKEFDAIVIDGLRAETKAFLTS